MPLLFTCSERFGSVRAGRMKPTERRLSLLSERRRCSTRSPLLRLRTLFQKALPLVVLVVVSLDLTAMTFDGYAFTPSRMRDEPVYRAHDGKHIDKVIVDLDCDGDFVLGAVYRMTPLGGEHRIVIDHVAASDTVAMLTSRSRAPPASLIPNYTPTRLPMDCSHFWDLREPSQLRTVRSTSKTTCGTAAPNTIGVPEQQITLQITSRTWNSRHTDQQRRELHRLAGFGLTRSGNAWACYHRCESGDETVSARRSFVVP